MEDVPVVFNEEQNTRIALKKISAIGILSLIRLLSCNEAKRVEQTVAAATSDLCCDWSVRGWGASIAAAALPHS